MQQKKKLLIFTILLWSRIKRRMKPKRKEMWMRKLFVERKAKGKFNTLVKDLMLSDHVYFFKSFRMSPTTFEQLLPFLGGFPHQKILQNS